MVIITDKVGQLGNRLFEFSYVIANAIENDYRVINHNFDDYEEYFEATANSKFDGYKISTRFKIGNTSLNKLFLKIQSVLNNRDLLESNWHKVEHISNEAGEGGGGISLNMNTNEFVSNAKNKIVFLSGAWYDDNDNFAKHAKLIRKYFTPKAFYQTKVLEKINSIRKENYILAGIHIRKGDYANFLDGEYYFENDVYVTKMQEIEEIFAKQGRKVQFLICSNEKTEVNDFSKFDATISTDHFIVDLYSLAQCDYIIGPPSTFSRWASFYGQVPLLAIDKEKSIYSLNDFEIVIY
jgi:hypothetical protein